MVGEAPAPPFGEDALSTAGKLAELRRRADAAKEARVARRRVDALLDPGSLTETGVPGAHGVIAGHGTVDGRPVCVWSVAGAENPPPGPAAGGRLLTVLDLALANGCPVVGIVDAGLGR